MVFSSFVFLFLFLPAVLFSYFIIPQKYRSGRNLILLCFSLLFYFYGEPKGILVMTCSILVNYTAARLLDRKGGSAGYRRTFLVLSLVFNLGVLFYYKYAGFALENFNHLFSTGLSAPQIIMPIGISFFTFQGMSYVFDVYRREVPAQRNILNVALYISLFPQLVAGPIVRYQTIERELSQRRESLSDVSLGLSRFLVGLGKKMLLANTLGQAAADIFAMDPAGMPAALAWTGAILYTFQIFFDFSGYSDMAIGLGRIFGFHFLENFNYPYISRSITEFWRRWHMSLSSWFRDYVYIPLGGNRKGLSRQLINILIVWALTGLWHGAAWNFVLWGLYFAVLLILEKTFLKRILDRLWAPLSHLYSLFFIIIGWVIFNTQDVTHLTGYLSAMFSFAPMTDTQQGQIVYILLEYKAELLAACIFSTPIARLLWNRFRENQAFRFAVNMGLVGLFAVCLMTLASTTFNPFIYFRF